MGKTAAGTQLITCMDVNGGQTAKERGLAAAPGVSLPQREWG